MGGNAFKEIPDVSFPRMSPSIYYALKSTLLALLTPLYERVAVPEEAPEKADHGDLDFVVLHPRPGTSPQTVQEALRATHCIPRSHEGRGTSNYAIPMTAFADKLRLGPETAPNIYVQVDVNLSGDVAEWENTIFLHSYGDFGMILGLLANSAKLTLSVFGLKLLRPVPTIPPQTFYLSSSLPDILRFYGLSHARWETGFATQRELFDWMATSALFDAPHIVTYAEGLSAGKKKRELRPMYRNFLDYAQQRAQSQLRIPQSEGRDDSDTQRVTMDEALRFFGKEAEYATLLDAARVKQHVREIFTGTRVAELAGMKQGLFVKWLMDRVLEELVARSDPTGEAYVDSNAGSSQSDSDARGNDPHVVLPWELTLFAMTEDEFRMFVMRYKNEMVVDGTFERKLAQERARKERKREERKLASTVVS